MYQTNSPNNKTMAPIVANSKGLTTPGQDGPQLKIQSSRRYRRNLLIDLPIGARLTLGFFAAALIAALVSGLIGFQHAQSAGQQSDFYKSLLESNTKLTTSAQYLQIIKDQVQTIIITMDSPQQSADSLKQETDALNNLIKLYDDTLHNYLNNDLIAKHRDQQNILAAAGRSYQIDDQNGLASSALRSWEVQKTSLHDISQYFQSNNPNDIAEAKYLQQAQFEPTNADALSAVRSLAHFNQQLADSVGIAEQVEARNEIITTAISSVVAFVLIVLVGLLISGTIVRRLTQLRQVTQAVEQGQLNRRVQVIGRDEIADVSASVNAMLEAIVGLVDETRNQRDALTNAAEHLFSDMRVVSAGDLRINAPVSNDPIGMLANAFNFTVGRFRRFVQRTKTTAEQMDVIAHQQIERAENFNQLLLSTRQPTRNAGMPTSGIHGSGKNAQQPTPVSGNLPLLVSASAQQTNAIAQMRQTREHIQKISQTEVPQHTQTITSLTIQIKNALERLTTLPNTASALNMSPDQLRRNYYDEVHTLNNLLSYLTDEAQTIERVTQQNFKDLDKELGQISQVVRNTLAVANDSTTTRNAASSQPDNLQMQELIKQSTNFANDMHTAARQFITMAQEIRTSIVNFQLDTVESGSNLSLPSGKLNNQVPANPAFFDYPPVPERPQMSGSKSGLSSPNRSNSGSKSGLSSPNRSLSGTNNW